MIKGYKGFDQNLRCRDFQFEVGGEYESDNSVKNCHSGFHFCENPIEVFNYYPPADSRYCEVEGDGEVDRSTDCDNDSKVAVSKLRIDAEIGLIGLINAGIKYILERIDCKNAKEFNTDNWSAATNTENWSAATNTGNQSVATNTGYRSVATNTGIHSVAANTGEQSAATNTSDQGAATNTGDLSAATNTGNRSAATNTGNQSTATNTGYRSAAINTGDQSVAITTGYQSAATNTGDWSAAVSLGDHSAVSVEGQESVAIATGFRSKAKGALGCWIVLAEWDGDDYWEPHIADVKCARVDGERIKPDVFYRLINGEFVEWTDED